MSLWSLVFLKLGPITNGGILAFFRCFCLLGDDERVDVYLLAQLVWLNEQGYFIVILHYLVIIDIVGWEDQDVNLLISIAQFFYAGLTALAAATPGLILWEWFCILIQGVKQVV